MFVEHTRRLFIVQEKTPSLKQKSRKTYPTNPFPVREYARPTRGKNWELWKLTPLSTREPRLHPLAAMISSNEWQQSRNFATKEEVWRRTWRGWWIFKIVGPERIVLIRLWFDYDQQFHITSFYRCKACTVGYMGSIDKQKSPSRFKLRKPQKWFALLLVNVFLIIGIIIAASRSLKKNIETSPTPTTQNSTNQPSSRNGSESVRLQAMEMGNIPKDIQNALIKVHRYMESKANFTSNERCQFAWKFNSRDNSTNLFICKWKFCNWNGIPEKWLVTQHCACAKIFKNFIW